MKKLFLVFSGLVFLLSTTAFSKDVVSDTSFSKDVTIESFISAGDKENLDKILDDYEKLIDEYIRLVKAAKAGDSTAMLESVSILERYQDLGERLEKNKEAMTPKQMKKFLRIQKKLLKVAASL